MKSPYFNEDHALFRQTVRDFVDKEIRPYIDEWEKNQQIPRSLWKKMGDQGYLGLNYPEQYGGSAADFFYSVIFVEELAKCGAAGVPAAVSVHQYMAVAHIAEAGSDELKEKYLKPAIAGDKIASLGISEPHAGSNVAGIKTRAVREGDHYIVNGSKTFITNGYYADFTTVAVITDPDAGVGGISLLVIDKNTPGFTANKLDKMGWHSSDTGELFFENVKVPVSNLIGEEGRGFYYIMDSFQLERLIGAVMAVGGCEDTLQTTLQYMKEREAFGRPIAKFQALRHKMADLASELESIKQFVHHTAWLHNEGEFAVQQCSMAKLLASELGKKMADECLQMFGGYGYMKDFPIERMYRDARVGTIVGGTSEIMREIITKTLIDDTKYDSAYKNPGKPKAAAASNGQVKPKEQTMEGPKPEIARDIIKSLESRFRPEKAGDFAAVFHFDIAGDNGGQFTATIGEGACKVNEGHVGSPTCTIATKDSVYEEIELGKRNPEMAVMMGKIKISNISEMMKFTKLFKRLF